MSTWFLGLMTQFFLSMCIYWFRWLSGASLPERQRNNCAVSCDQQKEISLWWCVVATFPGEFCHITHLWFTGEAEIWLRASIGFKETLPANQETVIWAARKAEQQRKQLEQQFRRRRRSGVQVSKSSIELCQKVCAYSITQRFQNQSDSRGFKQVWVQSQFFSVWILPNGLLLCFLTWGPDQWRERYCCKKDRGYPEKKQT